MKRIALFCAILMACVSFAAQALTPSPKKVAVYVVGDIERSERSAINSAVLARLSGNKEYVAFERNTAFINALDKEHDYQVSGEVPEKEIRAIGERLGVDYVIIINAEILGMDEECHMSARLVNLVTGEIIKSTSISREYTGAKVLVNMANNVAYRLINKKSK